MVRVPQAARATSRQRLIDHLERHDLGQLTQMTRGEHARRYRDLPGDDTLVLQRDSS